MVSFRLAQSQVLLTIVEECNEIQFASSVSTFPTPTATLISRHAAAAHQTLDNFSEYI